MKRKRSLLRTILLVLLLIFIAIQFLPVDRSVPAFDVGSDFVATTQPTAQLAATIKDACYDCHSYETEYPWYSYVAPVGQWLQGHIDHGREKLNFSTWTEYSYSDRDHALEEMIEMVKEKSMPLKSFTWMHGEARLTDAQRQEMVTWFDAQRTRMGLNR